MKNFIFWLITIFLFLIAESGLGGSNAVILQYHHVSSSTPSSTSVSPEQFKTQIEWLIANKFEVLPIPTIVDILLTRKEFSSDKVAAISFDDASLSVCETAWPILKSYRLPFTLFISTESVEKKFKSQCSWDMLREMTQSGLMTPANHSHRHLNMVSTELYSKPVLWRETVINEIETAQQLIVSKLGSSERLFAFPYGEYNSELATLVFDMGYIGFGQNSGAIGYESDFMALPRFPASGQHANIDTLNVKLLSLPFPAKISYETENPVQIDSSNNPPLLKFSSLNDFTLKQMACFTREGDRLPISYQNGAVLVIAPKKLPLGRHLYTCTSASPVRDRFYWISHQWLVE